MSTVSSNAMGIYALNGNVTSPLTVKVEASFVTTGGAPAGLAQGDYYLSVQSDGTFNAIGKVASGATDSTDATNELTLLSATTSSTLDASSTINEVAARNGTGGSTNYIASGAFSWNFSVDGLLDLTTGSGSAITLIDAARDQQFVMAKFTTDTNSGANEAFYVGQCLLESVSATGGVDDLATYSASLKGYGDLYKGA
jgi:hypothetical protein